MLSEKLTQLITDEEALAKAQERIEMEVASAVHRQAASLINLAKLSDLHVMVVVVDPQDQGQIYNTSLRGYSLMSKLLDQTSELLKK